MTEAEAHALMAGGAPGKTEADLITVTRNGSSWTGWITGVIGEPCMILENADRHRTAIVLSGARYRLAEDDA